MTLRGAWRLAGLLFIAGSLSTLPGTFLLEESFENWMYLLTAAGVLSGVACLMVPWWKVPERWLALVPVVAVLEIAVLKVRTETRSSARAATSSR